MASVSNNIVLVHLAVEAEISRTGVAPGPLTAVASLQLPVCLQVVALCAWTLSNSDTTIVVIIRLSDCDNPVATANVPSLLSLSKHVKPVKSAELSI